MSELVDILKRTREHLLTGVSYMIPFIVAGGVLFALAVALSGTPSVPEGGILGDIAQIGQAGFTLFIPILGGYIAYSIADRPGLAPGMIAAHLANQVGAGFLGALLMGIVAGIIVHYLKKIPVPKTFSAVMPIFIIPLVGSLIAGGITLWVVGAPIAGMMSALEAWLQDISTGSKIFLGLILGAMIAFDMGGPVNKTACLFSLGVLSEGIILPMGACGVAIMIPPMGLALATFLAPHKYTVAERENGKAALLMSFIGITEGAIPFAAADPLRVIPSIMTGSAVGGVIAMFLNVGNYGAWGGWIVLPVVENVVGYIIASLVGAAVTAVMVNALKKPIEESEEDMSEGEDSMVLSMD